MRAADLKSVNFAEAMRWDLVLCGVHRLIRQSAKQRCPRTKQCNDQVQACVAFRTSQVPLAAEFCVSFEKPARDRRQTVVSAQFPRSGGRSDKWGYR
jgi:hypothetical protein